MSLSSLYLDAFVEVAKQKNFSLAAEKLFITQSALSQRVLNLEKELGSSLLIRESSGLRLTELGEKLLRYALAKNQMEDEFMTNLQLSSSKSIGGSLKIASFSTLTNSVLIPFLAELAAAHPLIQYEVITAELRTIPELLASGQVDFAFSLEASSKQGIESHLIGHEVNVLARSTRKKIREDIYLDHDPEDQTTFDFFRHQGQKEIKIQRNFFGDIESLIQATSLGLGLAVIPTHLLKTQKNLEVIKKYKPMKSAIYFSYYKMPFYTDLQKLMIQQTPEKLKSFLES